MHDLRKKCVIFSPTIKEMEERLENLFKNSKEGEAEDILFDFLLLYTGGKSEEQRIIQFKYKNKIVELLNDGLKFRREKNG